MRLLLYLLTLLAVAAWRYAPRPWHPTTTLQTSHHTIYSSATRRQTEDTAHTLDLLYTAYSNRFGALPRYARAHPRLKVKLFKDRSEFRKVNPNLGWAEAFYREPYCQAYFSEAEANPYHWMLHESVHQLNNEVAHVKLEKWLEEGLAAYFSTSRLEHGQLALGRVDPDAYPAWWIDDLATGADLAENLSNGSVIPLRIIITNQGGPKMKSHFNLYYLHWWSLTHFLFESPLYRSRALELIKRGGTLQSVEQLLAPVEQVQTEWHSYIRQLKAAIREERARRLKPLNSGSQ